MRFPLSLFVLLISLFATDLDAAIPENLWTKSSGGSVDDYGNAVAVDSAGNSVTVGSFSGTGNFLGTSLVSSGVDDIFLLKLDVNGALVWARRAGGTTSDEAYATALDGAGNVYAAGRFTGTANFGTTNLTSAGTHDMFLAKYNSAGNLLWARRAGGTGTDYANGVATDANGNVFVTGVFNGTATFGGVTLTSSGSKDIFIAKYDSAGNFLWARKAGGTGTDVSFNIAIDGSGNAFITGWFVFTADFSGTSISVLGSQDVFLAKYDANGNFLWVRQSGGSASYDYGYSVAVDPAGNPCISGSFEGISTFGGITSLTSSGSSDMFVAKYSSTGNFLWAQKAGAPDNTSPFKANDDEAYSVAVNRMGDVFLTGYFTGTANFAGTILSNRSQYQDVFVAKYSSNGVFGWVKSAGGPGGSDYGNSIAMDADGNAYVAGTFYGAATFGTNSINSAGARDPFVTKISMSAPQVGSPTISDVTDKILNEDTPSDPILFTVSDQETPASNLLVVANSSNPTLFSSLVLGGSGTNRTLIITPATNSFGSATVTLTVTDSDGASSSDNFLVTVSPVNDAPTLNAITDVVINEDAGSTTVNFGGVTSGAGNESQTLTVSAASSNLALIPNPTVNYSSANATGSLNFAPLANASGTSTITVTVQDNGGTANGGINSFSRTFLVTVNPVNDPPTISQIADQTIAQNTSTAPLPIVIADLETAATSLGLAGNSSNTGLIPNANIVFGGSGNNRTVTITPAPNQTGSATITLAVNDGTVSVPTSFLVRVTGPNVPPTISQIPDQTINEDKPTGAIAFLVNDTETAATNLILSASSSDTNLVMNSKIVFGGSGANRTLVITPSTNQFGTSVISVFVSDGVATTNTVFLLTVNPVNDAPTLNPLSGLTINEDTVANVNLSGITSGATNETQVLNVVATSSNPLLIPHPVVSYVSASATGSLSIAPLANANGTATISITVQDDGGTENNGSNVITRTFLVTVNAVNDVPMISDISNQTVRPNSSSGPIPFVISDAETAATSLVVSRTSSNTKLIPNANIVLGGSGSNRTVTITPAAGKTGTATITISVSDGSATVSDSFLVTVTSANTVPAIGPITNQVINEDTPTAPIPFTVWDTETAATALIITATSSDTTLVPNANIVLGGSATNRTLVITPATNRFGSSLITVSVSDGTATTNRSFSLTVNPVNDAPVANNDGYTLAQGGTLNVSAAIGLLANDTDVETNSLRAILVTAPVNGTLQLNTNGSFTYVHNGTLTTSDTFVYKANDGALDSALATVNLTLSWVNHAPTFAAMPTQVVNEGTTLLITNSAVDLDSGDVLTFSLVSSPTGMSMTASGILSWTPTELDGPGTNVISIRVSDNGVPSLSNTNTFTIVVNEVNSPPTISPMTNRTVSAGTTLLVTNVAVDSDMPANALTFSLLSVLPGASLTTNGIFSWTPGIAPTPGTNLIVFKVTDSGVPSLSSTSGFFVVVAPSVIVEQPQIEKPQFVAGNTKLFFTAQAGQPYRIEYAPGTNGVWVPLRDIPAPAVTTNLMVNDGDYDSNRIYRLILPEAPPRIDRLTRNPEGVGVLFAVQAGQAYQVQSRESLDGEAWTVLTNFTASVSTNAFRYFDSRRRPQQFYRLATPLRLAAFSNIQKAPPSFSFQFAGRVGINYRVEYCHALSTDLWWPLTNVIPGATTNVLVFDNAAGNSMKFYRIRTN